METSATEKPEVNIVVVPRDSFSYTRESLESIYQETDYSFDLVYVDGGSPQHIKSYLEAQAREKQFKLIRTEHYLSPNRARNLGLQEVKSKYVVFIDNDVIVSPGWLKKLVQCAEETDAAVVGPLICINKPYHQVIHHGGAEIQIMSKVEGEKTSRHLIQNIYLAGKQVSKVSDQLKRIQCGFVEFHCVLVRTELFERIGPLDEKLLNTREHIDLCLNAAQTEGTIYCNRESVVTYLAGIEFDWWDFTYYMLRWSNAWYLATLHHLREKWNLEEDWYFQKRYNRVGDRRYRVFLKPVVSRFPFKEHRKWFADVLKSMEGVLNGLVSDSYARKHNYARHSLGLRKKDKVAEQTKPLMIQSVHN